MNISEFLGSAAAEPLPYIISTKSKGKGPVNPTVKQQLREYFGVLTKRLLDRYGTYQPEG